MAKRKPPKPTCLAIIVCESVVEDARTRNKCILNTYNGILAHSFPTFQDRLTLFVSLTGGRGKQPIRVYLVKDDASQEKIFEIRGEAVFDNPLDIAELILDCRRVPFPTAGHYSIKLDVAEEFIAERRIVASQIAKEQT